MECARSNNNYVLMMVVLGLFWSVSECYEFHVGGRDANWVSKPKESYNHWAERSRFQVNDTLVFKYKEGSDSVLVVSKEDYNSCNTTNPSLSLTDGHSTFKFDHSGPFYFISGNPNNCNQGQKLIVVVLAVRPKKHSPSTTIPAPSPAPLPSGASSPVATPSGSPPNTEMTTPTRAPAPAKSGSVVVSYSVGVVLASVAMSVVFGMF